jgi:gluconolactonase
MYSIETSMAAPGFDRIVPRGTALEQIATGLIFTEGPLWDPIQKALIFTDIRGDRIIKWQPGKGMETMYAPAATANGLTLDHENRILVAGWTSRTVWRLEPDGTTKVLASHWKGQKLNTPNDIVVKSDGTIWFTDMFVGIWIPGMCADDIQRYLDFEGMFRMNADGSDLALMVDDLDLPNGLCFSPDEKLMYVNETDIRRIRVWDVQPDNSVANGRVFYQDTGTEAGVADGMKVDIEGNVYVTGSAGIHVIAPDGHLLGRIHFPEHVANMAWGDDDWKTMYVTARGIVYRVRLGIPGVPHGEANRRQALGLANTR